MPFEFERQKIKDVILVKPKVFLYNRGFFMEAYKKSEFAENVLMWNSTKTTTQNLAHTC